MTVGELMNTFGFQVDNKSYSAAQNTITKLGGMAKKLLGAIGIGFSLTQMNKLAEEFNSINDQIRGATRGMGDQLDIQKQLLKAANDTKMSYNGYSQIVTKMIKMNGSYFDTVEKATEYTTNLSKALLGYGKSESEVQGAQAMLNRVFAEGQMTTSTYQRLLRQYPEIINTIADGLGVTTEEVRSFAESGQLTTDTIVQSINAAKNAQAGFEELDYSLSDAMLNIRNQWGLFVDQLWTSSNITNGLGKALVKGFSSVLGVFKKLMPFISKVVNVLIKGVTWVADHMYILEKLFGLLEQLLQKIKPRLESFIGKLSSGLSKVMGWIKSFVDKIGGVDTILNLLLISLGAVAAYFVGTKLISGIQTLTKAFNPLTLKIMLIIAAIALLVLAVQDFITFMNGGDSVIGKLLENAGVDVNEVRRNVLEFIQTAIACFNIAKEKFSEFFDKNLPRIQATLGRLWELIKKIFFTIGSIFSDILGAMFGKTADNIEDARTETEKFEDALDNVIEFFQNVYDAIDGMVNGIISFVGAIIDWIKAIWDGCSWIAESFGTLWDAVKRIFAGIGQFFEGIAMLMSGDSSKIMEAWQNIGQGLLNILDGIGRAIWASIQGLLGIIWSIISNFFSWIGSQFQESFQRASVIFNAIGNIVSTVFQSIGRSISTIFQTIGKAITMIFEAAGNKLSSFWAGIVAFAKNIWTQIQAVFNTAIEFITSLPGKALQWGKDFIQGFVNGIIAIKDKVVETVRGVAESIAEWLHFSRPDIGPLRDYEKWMPDFMQGMAKGIDQSKGKLLEAVKGATADLSMLVNASVAAPTTAANSVVNNSTNSVTQNVSINNSYSGGDRATVMNVSNAMNKSATDATRLMARGLAYGRA